jgi:LacI family transcriptional regulator
MGYSFHLRQNQPSETKNVVFVGRYNAGNDFYSAVLSGAERVCQQNQINLHFAQIDEASNQVEIQNTVDALLLAGSIDEQTVRQLMKMNRPIVLIDNNLPNLRLDRVLIQNTQSVYDTVMRFAAQGHKSIAISCGPQSHPSFRERLLGYRMAMEELGLPTQELISDITDIDYQCQKMKEWLEINGRPTFTVLLTENDHIAAGTLRALQDFKIRIPDEVSVIGFDDIETALATYPALTTHRVYREILGEMGARMLLDRMANPSRPTMSLMVDTTFIERDTTRRL